ncbi:MAG: NAD(P)/FAD-dependent oxidoreductase [Runella slithyformis]|nr:MAG: NAD(P)/FAD-dependent oxidoreductase [Runella slithyformis]TAF30007.1 MAG: NAD(P)/FAD-dependent oxidoreductase [Runella slithyformis]TAF49123.1 MAG: NAD(P)/FAD-dependent oxidoreductase [Runella slithyformis]TAF83618.1 MAG: NAD(P)/FAD-dependent oxidoreductase [Runella slithyformis]
MNTTHFDTIIVGAGISGISAAHYMQTECPHKTYTILEGRKSIGGTWDLFRYPGTRSDSDMFTFGFAFRPWTEPRIIAPRESIMKYLVETVQEEGIEQHIRFEHKLLKAAWSSETATWSLTVLTPYAGIPQIFTCSFLSLCMGYYDYENGYTPDFAGKDTFKGAIVHPQKWDEALDYSNKKIVVIGSGATAITLLPSLAKKAAHVTMLQRSPTYVVAKPEIDVLAVWLNKILPKKTAYRLNRSRNIFFQRITYALAKAYPEATKKILFKRLKDSLGKDFDVDKHFKPSYNPWDQRVCLVPDGDLFEVLKAKKASVVTDHIERFTERGIQLQSGEVLEADVIVTATGLNAKLFNNITFEIDGKPVDFSKKIAYKSVMLNNIPNMTYAFGYSNASWTLKCDMTNQYTCRLINYMTENGYKQCMPVQNDPNLNLKPFLDFSSGYVLRTLDSLPKMGDKAPWKIEQNYFYDKKIFEKSPLDDGILIYK